MSSEERIYEQCDFRTFIQPATKGVCAGMPQVSRNTKHIYTACLNFFLKKNQHWRHSLNGVKMLACKVFYR
jgi:hypothetical protein